MKVLTGPQLMLKTLGLDPEFLEAKGREFEALLKNGIAEIVANVRAMNERQARMEQTLQILLQESKSHRPDYAGPTYLLEEGDTQNGCFTGTHGAD